MDVSPMRALNENTDAAGRRRRQSDRELAKLGLVVSVGALVATGLMKTRTGRMLHLVAGGTLIGLSVWHHKLYTNGKGNARGSAA